MNPLNTADKKRLDSLMRRRCLVLGLLFNAPGNSRLASRLHAIDIDIIRITKENPVYDVGYERIYK